ncbi:MAG: Cytidylate kinase [Clostridiales bacterium 38_11]|nr:MAG: Cytidylate kinase [Clostridiales bacterium 38_11]HBH11825.1 (d)CMP kinase [Clostridiales bacterium]
MIIAIDGPAGAGKSTVAKRVSEILGFMFIDTGAIYRAITYSLIKDGIDLNNKQLLKNHLHRLDLEYTNQHIYFQGSIIDDEIREETISSKTSDYSKNPIIRSFATDFQRKLAENNNVVMEGRDIGTVVFPKAEFKFFLTANYEIRGRRRYQELKQSDKDASLEETIEAIRIRDNNDSNRELAPLKRAADAVEIDTSQIGIDQVIDTIIRYVRTED